MKALIDKLVFLHFYDKLKENLSILILIPALLGGMWQIFELSSISASYIRFFSVTQAIADGFLIIFVIAVIFLSIKVGDVMSQDKNIESPNVKTNIAFLILSTGAFLYAMLCIYLPFVSESLQNANLVEICLLICLTIIMFRIAFKILIGWYKFKWINTFFTQFKRKVKFPKFPNHTENVKINPKHNSLENTNLFKLIIMIVILMLGLKFVLSSIFPFIGKFRSEFVFPDNLKNYEYIECKVHAQYNSVKEFKVRYFNDSYIFIEVSLVNDANDILVLKFDDFFNDGNCN